MNGFLIVSNQRNWITHKNITLSLSPRTAFLVFFQSTIWVPNSVFLLTSVQNVLIQNVVVQ